MKRIIGVMVVAAMLFSVAPAFASGNSNNSGGDSSASATATANGGTHIQNQTSVNTNTNVNTQGQSQNQGQHQGQIQGQGQGQKQSADNKGVSQSVNVDSQMIPGVAVAPGLTSGGTQVCLGSFSVGISGPMAGVAFGKTVVDKGCEDRQNAILLFNMGFRTEALHLLMQGNDRVRALFPAVGPVKAAVSGPAAIEAAMAETQAATVESVQGQ